MTLLKQAENLLLKFVENMEIGKLSLVKNMSLKLDYQKGHAAARVEYQKYLKVD